MTTISNNNKSISYKLENDITVINNHTYKVNLPTIICSTEKDAVYMQEFINEFVNDLSKKLIKED